METDRRNRVCPKCGTGAMPTTAFCIRCGAELPPMEADPDRVARQKERERVAHETALYDLFPGLRVPGVLVGSLIAGVAGVGFSVAFIFVFAASAKAGGFGTIFGILLAVGLGAIGVGSFASGVSWLMYGELCMVWEAWSDFRTRHWVAFCTLMLAVFAAYGAAAIALRAGR